MAVNPSVDPENPMFKSSAVRAISRIGDIGMIHFIFGPTGAGKTAYAMKLAEEKGAIRFAVDDWMNTLFFPDLHSTLTYDWAMERVNRCEAQIWKLCRQVLMRGKAVVLEISMSTKILRDKQRRLAEENNTPYQLHYIDADREVRRARVEKRNKDKGATYFFDVTDDMFDFVENMFEAPTPEELEEAVVIRN